MRRSVCSAVSSARGSSNSVLVAGRITCACTVGTEQQAHEERQAGQRRSLHALLARIFGVVRAAAALSAQTCLH